MKKITLLVLSLMASTSLLASTPLKPFDVTNPKQAPAKVQKRALEPVVLLSEDFSQFVAGTDTEPDATAITSGDNYYISDELTSMPGWTGLEIYAAGGACAVMPYYNDYYYENSAGYLSTPEMNLYGTATITFRAKRLPGSSVNIWLALCDNYYGPIDSQDITLTEEWQTFTFTSSQAENHDYNIFQITGDGDVNGGFVVDDVVVTLVADKISTPYPNPAENLSTTSFKASWEPVDNATFYNLHVYYKGMPDNVVSGSVQENFDGINVDGTKIDAANPNYPEGWTFTFAEGNNDQISTTEGNFASGPNAVHLSKVGDQIVYETLPAPANYIEFWVKPSNMDYPEDYYYAMIGVSVFDGNNWIRLANLPNYWMEADGGVYSIEAEAIGLNATKFKLEIVQEGIEAPCTFYIDDVVIEYETQPLDVDFCNEQVTDTYKVVEGIDPTLQYYFIVQASNGELTSEESYPTLVDGVQGLDIEATEATDLTAESFTANWTPLHHADIYTVAINRITKAETDMTDVVVLHEDFNKITEGTVDYPVTEWVSPYDLAANGKSDNSWMLTQPQWAEGMAGSQGTSWLGAAGLVASPVVSLDNNGGQFKVKATVYNTVADDEIFVMLLKTLEDSQALAACVITCGEPGLHTAEVEFKDGNVGQEDVIVAFMSKSGLGFFVDEVTVLQDLKAGETLERPYKTMTSEVESLVVEVPAPDVYNYAVTAQREKDFVTYTSNTSNVVEVDLTHLAGVESVATDGNAKVYANDGAVEVLAHSDARVAVYSLQGYKVAEATGSCHIALAGGFYIVNVDGTSFKVAVK